MYIIDEYQLIQAGDSLYLGNYGIGAKIANQKLAAILKRLQIQPQREINEAALVNLAETYQVSVEQLKSVLVEKLNILQPRSSRKLNKIYLNTDDAFIAECLEEPFSQEYELEIVEPTFQQYEPKSLVLFYRSNYSHADFKKLYQSIPDDVYFITAGVIHKILIIDNLYFKGSGLPSHFSNLHNLLACIHNDIAITKNNWLLFYRQVMKETVDQFPDPVLTKCQRGYIAYSLQKFMSQFTSFWKIPTTLDEVNWFWHVDLNSFSVNREVAVHSPYSEYDMNLDMKKLKIQTEFEDRASTAQQNVSPKTGAQVESITEKA